MTAHLRTIISVQIAAREYAGSTSKSPKKRGTGISFAEQSPRDKQIAIRNYSGTLTISTLVKRPNYSHRQK
jgi:hypothetical protein